MSDILAVIDHGSEWAVVNYMDASDVRLVGSFAECEALADSPAAWTFGFNEAIKRVSERLGAGERPSWDMDDGNRDDVAELAAWIERDWWSKEVLNMRISQGKS